jgi:hypothetical protein
MSDSPVPNPLSWRDVLALHGSRRGIRVTEKRASILLDFGLSPYVNRREGYRIHYQGEGKRGDQTLTSGNAGLLRCLEERRAVRVFERVRPGVWFDRGAYLVVNAVQRFSRVERRHVFEFTLQPDELENRADV